MGQKCPHKPEKVYRSRHPEKTPFYSVLFHHFDRFVGQYDLRFEKHYGKWRAVIAYVVAKYLDCGMRIRCPSCREEYLLALMCASYYTSCGQIEACLTCSCATLLVG